MRILIVGSGGREHAIARAFALSGRVSKIYCASGNAGIAELAELVPIDPTEIDKLADLAAEEQIDLTFVGGESALALGIVDTFRERGLKIVGASRSAARLESSKAFAKDFMSRHSIPTASYAAFGSAAEAEAALEAGKFGAADQPVVVKADGLAAGKGVVVASDRAEAVAAVRGLAALVGAEAAGTIILEECLIGLEVSLMMFCDGTDFALMPPTRDHKRIGNGDTGPNTGGMGAITDSSLLPEGSTQEVIEQIIVPTLAGCADEGFPFSGILFLGLMMTAQGPKLLEYNVRLGDPETQAVLVRLESDMVEICEAILEHRLGDLPIKWKEGSSACVVLAAEGYPGKPSTGDVIEGLDAAAMKDISIFHSGTERGKDGKVVTAGGRVISVTATGDDLETAIGWAYHAAGKISWRGMQFRTDIGMDSAA